MEARPEVFDWRCRLFFYRAEVFSGSPRDGELRFVAVPDDPGVKIVLRGVMASHVPTLADRGRLLGIRRGNLSALWTDEARKVHVDPSVGFRHDLVLECRWYPDPLPVPAPVRAYWPSAEDLVV